MRRTGMTWSGFDPTAVLVGVPGFKDPRSRHPVLGVRRRCAPKVRWCSFSGKLLIIGY
jgi:hypothetical protein